MSTPYVDKIKEIGAGAEVQIYADSISGLTWTNEAKAAHDLTITGGVVNTSGGPATNLTKYVEFDGIDDYADTPHHADLTFTTNGTHGVWVWIPTNWGDSQAASPIFSKGGGDYELRESYDSNNTVDFDIIATYGLTGPVPLSFEEWLFFVVTVEGSVQTMYQVKSGDTSAVIIDGPTSILSYTQTTNPFALAARASDKTRNFNGRITGYFALPGVLLTQTDVWDIYQAASEEASSTELSATVGGTSTATASATIPSHWTDWVSATTARPRFEEDDTRLEFAGTWSVISNSERSGGAYQTSSTAGSTMRVSFRGANFYWLGTVGPGRGIATVTVDDLDAINVDLYAAEWEFQKYVWDAESLSLGSGDHLLTITVTGTRNASSTNSSIEIDAVEADEIFTLHEASGTLSPYAEVVRADNPLAHWNMASPDSRGVVYGAVSAEGMSGPSLSLDGVDDYYAVDFVAGATSELTWEAWIYRVSTASDQMFMGYDPSASFYFRTVTSELFGSIYTSGGQKTLWGVAPLAYEQWHHVVMRFDGTTLELYVDGQLDVAHEEDLSATTLSAWGVDSIGRWRATDPRWFGGRVDEVAVYDYGLSPSRILDHYNAKDDGSSAVTGEPSVLLTAGGSTSGDAVVSATASILRGASAYTFAHAVTTRTDTAPENVIPPKEEWTLLPGSGEAYFDGDGRLVLKDGGVALFWVYTYPYLRWRVGARATAITPSVNASYDEGFGGWHWNSNYYAEDKTTSVENEEGWTTNGNAAQLNDTTINPLPVYHSWAAPANQPNVYWTRISLYSDTAHASSHLLAEELFFGVDDNASNITYPLQTQVSTVLGIAATAAGASAASASASATLNVTTSVASTSSLSASASSLRASSASVAGASSASGVATVIIGGEALDVTATLAGTASCTGAVSLLAVAEATSGGAATVSASPSALLTVSGVIEPPADLIDFTSTVWTGAGSQDEGTVTVHDDGTRLEFANNVWKLTETFGPHEIDANTVIEFDLRVDGPDIEIVGVGFGSTTSTDITNVEPYLFHLYGTQAWGGYQDIYTYTSTVGTWQSFSIPVGSHYTGTFPTLWFVGDDDAAPLETWAVRNFRISSSSSSSGTTATGNATVLRSVSSAVVAAASISGTSSALRSATSQVAGTTSISADGTLLVAAAGAVAGAGSVTGSATVILAEIILSLVRATSTSAELAWTEGGSWDDYLVERDGQIVHVTPLLTFTDTSLEPLTEYAYRVRGRVLQ